MCWLRNGLHGVGLACGCNLSSAGPPLKIMFLFFRVENDHVLRQFWVPQVLPLSINGALAMARLEGPDGNGSAAGLVSARQFFIYKFDRSQVGACCWSRAVRCLYGHRSHL